jgi:hypothetical protein
MRMQYVWQNVALVLLLGSASGCASDDAPSDADGVSRSKIVSELSDEESERFCERLKPKMTELQRSAERLSCLINVLGMDECEDESAGCDEQAAKRKSTVDCAKSPEDLTGGEECDVSVGELDDCFDALVADGHAYEKKLSCETALEDLTEPKPIKVCTDIADDCVSVAILGSR